MDNHKTPLSYHLKQKHTWFDLSLLLILWLVVYAIPENLWHFKGVSLTFFAKITALVASLEFISFLSFHLLSGKNSLLLQGFLGGFVSSTTVFVQLNYDKRFEDVDESLISRSLLLATCSMLIECLLIILSISGYSNLRLLYPFGLMLIFLLFFLIYHRKKKNTPGKKQDTLNNLEIDDPIIWKKVMTLSLYIAVLKFGMILLQELTHFPVIIATFIASLFEAHAILAVNAGSFSSQLSLWEMHFIMLIILTGSLISKMFFVYRGKVLSQKRKLFIPILTSFFLTLALTYMLSV